MSQAVGLYFGKVPNPHIVYGQDDIDTAPTTFANIATRWGDVQLSNGWMWTNWGKKMDSPKAHYLVAVNPSIPGQDRIFGTHPADFPMRGPAPSQWDYHVASTAGAQPNYPGGPGYVMGSIGGRAGSSGG